MESTDNIFAPRVSPQETDRTDNPTTVPESAPSHPVGLSEDEDDEYSGTDGIILSYPKNPTPFTSLDTSGGDTASHLVTPFKREDIDAAAEFLRWGWEANGNATEESESETDEDEDDANENTGDTDDEDTEEDSYANSAMIDPPRKYPWSAEPMTSDTEETSGDAGVRQISSFSELRGFGNDDAPETESDTRTYGYTPLSRLRIEQQRRAAQWEHGMPVMRRFIDEAGQVSYVLDTSLSTDDIAVPVQFLADCMGVALDEASFVVEMCEKRHSRSFAFKRKTTKYTCDPRCHFFREDLEQVISRKGLITLSWFIAAMAWFMEQRE